MAVTTQITIAGCGPGAPAYIPPMVQQAVRDADVLVGARRLLDLFADHPGEKIPVGADIEAVLQSIEAHCATRRVIVLVTGDPGLCSLAGPVLRHFGRAQCRVIPGISAVQAAFAALGLDWLEARIINAHGALPALDTATLRQSEKMAVLLGSRAGVAWAARLLEDLGTGHRAWLCEELTLPGERIREIQPGRLEEMDIANLSILVILNGKE